MFRITFIVDDKQLASALRALVSISRGAPEVVPVVNAEPTKKGITAKASSLTELVFKTIRDRKVDRITGPQIAAIIKDIGGNPKSLSYYVRTAIDNGVLKPVGRDKAGGRRAMHYAVVQVKA